MSVSASRFELARIATAEANRAEELLESQRKNRGSKRFKIPTGVLVPLTGVLILGGVISAHFIKESFFPVLPASAEETVGATNNKAPILNQDPRPSPSSVAVPEGVFSVDTVCMDDLENPFPHTKLKIVLPRANMNGLIYVSNLNGPEVGQSPLDRVVADGRREGTISRYLRSYSGNTRLVDQDVNFEKGNDYRVLVKDLDTQVEYSGDVLARC